jgi:hypothetical protein
MVTFKFSSCFGYCTTVLIIVDLLCSLKEFEEGKQEVMCQEIANLRDKVRGDLFVKNLSDIHSTNGGEGCSGCYLRGHDHILFVNAIMLCCAAGRSLGWQTCSGPGARPTHHTSGTDFFIVWKVGSLSQSLLSSRSTRNALKRSIVYILFRYM